MSEKPKREISDERREKMLANLQRGRQKRLENLAAKKKEMDKYKKQGIKETTKTETQNNKKETTPRKTPKIYPKKYACPCGKEYVGIKGLNKHQLACKYFQEKKQEEDEVQAEIETIARDKIKSRKKKTKIAEVLGEETESGVQNVKVEVEEEQPKVAAVHIPKPVETPPPPPPQLIRQPPADEPKRFTMQEWSDMRREEEQKRAQEQKAKKEEAENARLQKAIAAMKGGGIGGFGIF